MDTTLLPPYLLSFPICFASYFDVLVHLFIMLSLEPVFFYIVLTHIKHFSVTVDDYIAVSSSSFVCLFKNCSNS